MCCTLWKTGSERKNRLWWLIPVILILPVILFAGKQGSQRLAAVRLTLWERPYTQAAEAVLDNKPYKNLPGVRYVNVWPCGEERMVEYHMGGGGLGSSTHYWGVYTTTDGKPFGWQGMELPLTAEGGGWIWQEDGGDNAYYTRELLPGWYYYRMEF